MNFFGNEDISIERIWCGDEIGTKLRVEHGLSGMVLESVIGFEEEKIKKSELIAELRGKVLTKYPPGDFLINFLNGGPGKGESLQLVHKPTGVAVDRFVGYDKRDGHIREALREMFGKLRGRGK